MTLRSKLLLAQAPAALAVIAVGILASVVNGKLGRSSALILKDNYRSVLAAQRMKEAIERIDSAALFMVAGERQAGAQQSRAYIPRFEGELETQEGNVTEAGEQDATRALRSRWDRYRRQLEALEPLSTDAERKRAYFGALQPAFLQVKEGADVILAINQDAMVRKSDRARQMARQLDAVMIVAALLACALGLATSLGLTTRLLRPLGVLRQAARRLGEGDPKARARVEGRDEIAEVAGEFNTMADRLAQYRASSLGDLLAAQQQSQAAIDSLPDPVLVFDTAGRLLAVNRATEQRLRVTVGDSADVQEPLAPAPPEVRTLIDRVRAHVLAGNGAYQPKGLEEAIRTSAGAPDVFLLPRATPVSTDRGGLIGVAILLQDVTRLMRFDELKTNLVATVAHEFRTPLTSLRMALHLCLEQAVGPLTEAQADLLYAARQDTERLQQIVDDLLDLSRIQDGRIELHKRAVDAATLAREAVPPWKGPAEDKELELRVEVLPGLGDVVVDPDRINLAFANLLANAIKHTPGGGKVTLHAERRDDVVRYSITDTGPGIPAEYHQAVFDKFFRMPGTVATGAGLGLFIAREIVEAHDGRIGVESPAGPAGRGSRFWFELPSAHS